MYDPAVKDQKNHLRGENQYVLASMGWRDGKLRHRERVKLPRFKNSAENRRIEFAHWRPSIIFDSLYSLTFLPLCQIKSLSRVRRIWKKNL